MLDEILNNTEGYVLDKEQQSVVLDDSDSLLVVAGAGSGKTLTILAKIRYLIDVRKILPDEILCISFTRDTVRQLKKKLAGYYNFEIPVYTFHKLSLEILKNEHFLIAPSNYLSYVVNEYFLGIVEAYPKLISFLLLFFHKNPFSKKEYEKLKHSIKFQCFIKEMVQVIEKLKSEGVGKEMLLRRKTVNPRSKFFFRLIYLLMNEYEVELTSQRMIDFDDMIFYASEFVKNHSFKKIKYILIDEYQDTSNIRFALIQSIKEKTGAKLMAVGDDFQSIYRFSGCKLELFTFFSSFFPNSTILKLQNTYRNSQELIDIAGNFILRNKNQLRKVLKSNKTNPNPIQILMYQDERLEFFKLIESLYQSGKRKVMVLGRNNGDVHFILSSEFSYEKDGHVLWKNHLDMDISYKTVHCSKGLEEEVVILIHLENCENGFPNKRRESSIMRSMFPNYDFYPYSEERRLFYVALTRTKNEIYLLSSKKRPSIFILELLSIMKYFRKQEKKHFSNYKNFNS